MAAVRGGLGPSSRPRSTLEAPVVGFLVVVGLVYGFALVAVAILATVHVDKHVVELIHATLVELARAISRKP